MIWLIIALVVGLVFAPAMWLRPSLRQQRTMTLRDAAKQAGLQVRLDPSPLHQDDEKLPAYRWTYPPRQPGPDFLLLRDAEASDALKVFVDGWRWRTEPLRAMPTSVRAHFEALLVRLPEDAVAVESSAEALTLWWDESLEKEAFMPLADQLAELRDGLAGRPDRPEKHADPKAPRV
ncbi:preprotein translocase subunit YajC [Halomonas getboli]|uniref:preprotein translocase subunit YajC n=1 Tax=Halomonas getboli TaxID=2935862 RepID=UPI001FFE3F79|nr:preprotein translocase subunit YajC [Halomonas getboli]MCK2182411.1 preprotein translocase subunit YajC [Halomonas getboli]